jgi:hypothetical protein
MLGGQLAGWHFSSYRPQRWEGPELADCLRRDPPGGTYRFNYTGSPTITFTSAAPA